MSMNYSTTFARLCAETVLDSGAWVFLHVDGRNPEARLPDYLVGKASVLQIGRDMPKAIPDLHTDEHVLSATLSFNGTSFFCVVPWAAVLHVGVYDTDGKVDHLVQFFGPRADAELEEQLQVPAPPSRGSLRCLPGKGGPC